MLPRRGRRRGRTRRGRPRLIPLRPAWGVGGSGLGRSARGATGSREGDLASGARSASRHGSCWRPAGVRNALLFAAAVTAIAWEVWPGSSAGFATRLDRVDLVTMVLVLAGLALSARRFLGPVRHDSRIAEISPPRRPPVSSALVPARAAIEAFSVERPNGVGPRSPPPGHRAAGRAGNRAVCTRNFLILASCRSTWPSLWWSPRAAVRIAPATLFIGTVAGLVLGAVMYFIAPLGLSSVATNPWLPGSDIDPLVVLAWILVLLGPWERPPSPSPLPRTERLTAARAGRPRSWPPGSWPASSAPCSSWFWARARSPS